MTEKVKDLLFRPKKLRALKNSKLYKAFLYLFIIALFSSAIPVLNTLKFTGFDVYDREISEQLGFDFETAKKLPDCKITNNDLNCKVEEPQTYPLGKLEGSFVPIMYNLVVDEQSTFEDIKDDELYFIFTNDAFVVSVGRNAYPFLYEDHPDVFESVDFNVIRDSSVPEDELFTVFIGLVNNIYEANNVFFNSTVIIFIYFMTYIQTIFRVLFYSFVFFIFLLPFKVKYGQVFKVTSYAITLGTVLNLMFSLYGFADLGSFVLLFITFIYVSRALRTMPPVRKGQ